MKKTKYFSWKNGPLTEGCKQCVKGEKTVLFLTGICNRKCYFCPISDKKKGHDDVYANEWKISSKKDLIDEIRFCKSKGVGITGGDPLLKIDRCVDFMTLLKKKFGKKFHIHLYTSLNNATKERLGKLFKAGLDEIRLHPDLDKPEEWPVLDLIKKYKWKVGVEIPIIPGKEKQTINLIRFINDKVDFLNLNELEIADNESSKLEKLGFHTKDSLSYGIKGSQEMAFRVARFAKIPVHYCTCTLKDRVQLTNRIKRRARFVSKRFDKVTADGTILRGVVYLKELPPGSDYELLLKKMDKKALIEKLKRMRNDIIAKDKINPKDILIDVVKFRLITGIKQIRKIKSKNRAIVEEMPTHDGLEMEIEFIRE